MNDGRPIAHPAGMRGAALQDHPHPVNGWRMALSGLPSLLSPSLILPNPTAKSFGMWVRFGGAHPLRGSIRHQHPLPTRDQLQRGSPILSGPWIAISPSGTNRAGRAPRGVKAACPSHQGGPYRLDRSPSWEMRLNPIQGAEPCQLPGSQVLGGGAAMPRPAPQLSRWHRSGCSCSSSGDPSISIRRVVPGSVPLPAGTDWLMAC